MGGVNRLGFYHLPKGSVNDRDLPDRAIMAEDAGIAQGRSGLKPPSLARHLQRGLPARSGRSSRQALLHQQQAEVTKKVVDREEASKISEATFSFGRP
jgi:hypothetical protein